MESILAWTLVIAAIAIVLMLILLLSSEGELKRKRAEVASLRSRYQERGTGATTEFDPEVTAGSNLVPYAEIIALTEQLQSSRADIETMWTEIERLRAENAKLGRENARIEVESAELRAPLMEHGGVPQPLASGDASIAQYRPQNRPQNRRALYVVSAGAFLLAAGMSVYFARPWRQSIFTPAGQTHQSITSQSVETVAANEAVGTVDSGAKTDENAPGEIAPPKKIAPRGASYEVVRSTRVFSRPNESSRPLSRVEAGMEINVVGARDDWLEVRSRHGRPPGFIKKDTAIMKQLN
jgi:regulator of replication initiation timing